MNDSDTLISVRDLKKTFRTGLFSGGFRALDGISLEVGRGMVFGLLGPNGAGKTTLIKILLGLVKGYEGEARVFGRLPSDHKMRERIGYLPEAHRLPGYMTGKQTLRLYGMYSGKSSKWLDVRTKNWIERVGMKGSAGRKVRQYSKGMQQRIGLAQAMVHEPDLVFLDEPTDGVDPVGRAAIREIVAELRDKGTTVFINSHLLMEVEQICDHIVIMRRGQIIRQGTIAELTPDTGRVEFGIDLSTGAPIEEIVGPIGSSLQRTSRGFEIAVDEDGANAIVDRLRGSGVSIRSISPRKLTLEDTFIDLVQGEEQ